MKIQNFLKVFLVVLVIISCSDDDSTPQVPTFPQPTIADIVAGESDYSSLLAALEKTNLTATLAGAGTFTVFAPNNAAFDKFLDGTPLADVDNDALTKLLLNHVLGAKVNSADINSGYVSTLAMDGESGSNLSMYVNKNTTGTVKVNGDVTVTAADLQASNGVVHLVDQVIKEPTLLTFVVADPELSALAGAATKPITDALSGNTSLTLLAPNDTAFGGVDLSGLSSSDLEKTLLNHVIADKNLSTGLSTSWGNTLATYGSSTNNLSVYIDTTSGVRFNGMSSVITADVVASNGIMHKVDGVLTLPTIVTFATADPNFSSLVAALTRMDVADQNYVETLSTQLGTAPAPFTVFAPTDDAFASLLTELGASGLGDIDKETLIATLNHHVIAASNVRSTDLTDGDVTTLGGDVTIQASAASITDKRGRVSKVIAADVQAANGVIHAIDNVILPPAAK